MTTPYRELLRAFGQGVPNAFLHWWRDMAFSAITARGQALTETGGTTLSMNPSANLVVNKLVFVMAVTDNSATADGPSSTHTSVADNAPSTNNLWRKITEYTETDGSAGDGCTVSVWGCRITTQISTTDTITVTTSNVTARSIIATEVTVEAGNTFTVEEVGVGQATRTAAVGVLPNREHLYLYFAGAEGADQAKAITTFSEIHDFRTGVSATDSVSGYDAALISTDTGEVSTAATGWTGTNFMSLLVAMYETIGSPSVSPSASVSPSISPSTSESPSISPSASTSPSASISPSASESPSISPSAS